MKKTSKFIFILSNLLLILIISNSFSTMTTQASVKSSVHVEVSISQPNVEDCYDETCILDFKKENELFFQVYPNPIREYFTLELIDYNCSSMLTVEIFTIEGKQIKFKKLSVSKYYQFNLRDYPSGIYLIRVSQGERVGSERIIK